MYWETVQCVQWAGCKWYNHQGQQSADQLNPGLSVLFEGFRTNLLIDFVRSASPKTAKIIFELFVISIMSSKWSSVREFWKKLHTHASVHLNKSINFDPMVTIQNINNIFDVIPFYQKTFWMHIHVIADAKHIWISNFSQKKVFFQHLTTLRNLFDR